MTQNTWTLIATARNSWGIPSILETVTGVKTNKTGEVAASLYAKYPNTDGTGCHEVAIKKESK